MAHVVSRISSKPVQASDRGCDLSQHHLPSPQSQDVTEIALRAQKYFTQAHRAVNSTPLIEAIALNMAYSALPVPTVFDKHQSTELRKTFGPAVMSRKVAGHLRRLLSPPLSERNHTKARAILTKSIVQHGIPITSLRKAVACLGVARDLPWRDQKRALRPMRNGEKLLRALISRLEPKIFKAAKYYSDRFNSSHFEDLTQEGRLAIERAIFAYDKDKGTSFLTYVGNWFEQGMQMHIYNLGMTVRLPVWVQKLRGKFRKSLNDARSHGGPDPTSELLDRFAGEKETHTASSRAGRQVLRAALTSYTSSLDMPMHGDTDKTGAQSLESKSLSPLATAEVQDLSELVNVAFRDSLLELNQREGRILYLRYFGNGDGTGMSLKQIGDEYNITAERVRQIASGAMEKIRGRLERQLRRRDIQTSDVLSETLSIEGLRNALQQMTLNPTPGSTDSLS